MVQCRTIESRLGMRPSDDVREIKLLIARQFASLNWTTDAQAIWDDFASSFFSGGSLYPAARPAKRQTVEGFIERMKRFASAWQTLASGPTHRAVRGSALVMERKVPCGSSG